MRAVATGLVELMAATAPSGAGSWWEYALLFLAVTASWAGVPGIGSAALAAAAVAASQGHLDLTAVIVVSSVAGEVGGLIGYWIGIRWGTQLLARPGKRQAGRQKLADKGELAYRRWGRLAVFVTPAIISGTAKMRMAQFAVWNLIASVAFTLSVAATAYGIGRVSTGHQSAKDVAILLVGLVMIVVVVFVRRRRHRGAPGAPA